MIASSSLSLLGAFLMFLGGAFLTIYALTIRKRIKTDRGATILNEILRSDNPIKDLGGRTVQDRNNLELWLSRGTFRRAWIGFLLTTIGFLLDLVSKLVT